MMGDLKSNALEMIVEHPETAPPRQLVPEIVIEDKLESHHSKSRSRTFEESEESEPFSHIKRKLDSTLEEE